MDEIRLCTAAEFQAEPNIDALFAQYADESAIAELGHHDVRMDIYEAMETAGALRVLVAHRDNVLVGFAVLTFAVLPHFGKLISSTESFFVAPDARKGGLGVKLLRAAEQAAKDAGAIGLFVSAPVKSRLASIMPRSGYRQTNEVFFRGFA